jgi:hypothetical protein
MMNLAAGEIDLHTYTHAHTQHTLPRRMTEILARDDGLIFLFSSFSDCLLAVSDRCTYLV